MKRSGKQTLTGIKRERAIVVSLRPPLWQGGESPTNVFGHKPLRAAQLKELYQKEESDQFKDLIIKAQKKAEEQPGVRSSAPQWRETQEEARG